MLVVVKGTPVLKGIHVHDKRIPDALAHHQTHEYNWTNILPRFCHLHTLMTIATQHTRA